METHWALGQHHLFVLFCLVSICDWLDCQRSVHTFARCAEEVHNQQHVNDDLPQHMQLISQTNHRIQCTIQAQNARASQNWHARAPLIFAPSLPPIHTYTYHKYVDESSSPSRTPATQIKYKPSTPFINQHPEEGAWDFRLNKELPLPVKR